MPGRPRRILHRLDRWAKRFQDVLGAIVLVIVLFAVSAIATGVVLAVTAFSACGPESLCRLLLVVGALLCVTVGVLSLSPAWFLFWRWLLFRGYRRRARPPR